MRNSVLLCSVLTLATRVNSITDVGEERGSSSKPFSPTAWLVQNFVVGSTTFAAPPISDRVWEQPGEVNKEGESHMAVLRLGDVFHVPEEVHPAREDIARVFSSESAMGDNAGKSGADLMMSSDGNFVAKRIKKIEVKYVHKIIANLRKRGNPETLLVPIYYLFQRCKWPVGVPIHAFSDLSNQESSKGLWRDCDAWMVSPKLDLTNAVKAYDVKGNQGILGFTSVSLHGKYWGAEDEELISDYPQGLTLESPDFVIFQGLLKTTVEFMQEMELNDYSMLIKVGAGQDECTGSRDAKLYRAVDRASQSESQCIAVGVIDYLGSPAFGAGRKIHTAARNSRQYAESFLASIGGNRCSSYIHAFPCASA